MKLVEISEKQYNEFAQSYNNHFMSSINNGKRYKSEGKEVIYLGFKKDVDLIGAALLTSEKSFLNKKRFMCNMGPLINYNDKIIVEESFKLLKDYFVINKALTAIVGPNQIYRKLYPNKEEPITKYVKDTLEDLGYSQIDVEGNSMAYLRHYFLKDLSKYNNYNELFESYSNGHKRKIRRTNTFPLSVEKSNFENLDEVIEILDLTADEKDFTSRDIEFHKTFFKSFNTDNAKVLYLKVVLDAKKYKDEIMFKLNNLTKQKELESLKDSKKAKNRLVQISNQIESLQRSLLQLEDIEEKVLLSAGVFVLYNDTITYLFGGNDRDFDSFLGGYYLQDYMLKYALENNFKTYDFYGTRNTATGHVDEEGVYQFKKGFDGKLIENLGYYEFMPNNMVVSIFKLVRNIKNRVR